MEPIVLWQTKWSQGPFVPLYLFFGGLTAGLFVVAVVADLLASKWQRFEPASKIAAYSAVAALALAGFFVTMHLGKPERGMAFPMFFTNYNSWMTRGGWIVGSGGPLVVLYAALWFFTARSWLRRVVGILGIPFLLMLGVYTGFLLSGAGFAPLWSKKFLPALFLSSGLTGGLALTGLLVLVAWPFIKEKSEDPIGVIRWVSLAVAFFILLELYELYSFMTYLQTSDQRTPTGEFIAPKGGFLAYEYVIKGGLAPWFWWGVVGFGLTLPLALTVIEFIARPWARAVAAAKFALVVAGGALLRFVIVWGGDLKAPLNFPPSKWPIPPIAGG